MELEVSLFEVDTWLESRNDSVRSLPEPAVRDSSMQVGVID